MNYRRMGKRSTGKKDAFTAAEVVSFMRYLPNSRIGHSIRLMIACGIGPQETLALSAFDIDSNGSRISVRAVKIKKGVRCISVTYKPKSVNVIFLFRFPLRLQQSFCEIMRTATSLPERKRGCPYTPRHTESFTNLHAIR